MILYHLIKFYIFTLKFFFTNQTVKLHFPNWSAHHIFVMFLSLTSLVWCSKFIVLRSSEMTSRKFNIQRDRLFAMFTRSKRRWMKGKWEWENRIEWKYLHPPIKYKISIWYVKNYCQEINFYTHFLRFNIYSSIKIKIQFHSIPCHSTVISK